MRTRIRPIHGLALALTLGLAAGCGSSPSSPGSGTMRVRMTDAPGDFDEVNLVITEVSVRRTSAASDSDSVSGEWLVISDGSATYDLMDLRNGVFATIADDELPAGSYDQVRLKIGEGSTVVVDGVSHPLVVPSGASSGLKLVGAFDVEDGGTTDIGLDFDAARSIHETGNGRWMLKPVVRVMPLALAGSIRGRIVPDSTDATVWLVQGAESLATTAAALDGRFQFSVLEAGTYTVAIHPDSGWRDTTLTGVVISGGSSVDLGDVALTPQ